MYPEGGNIRKCSEHKSRHCIMDIGQTKQILSQSMNMFGTEPSHMHNTDDENYMRGCEWMLMVETKKARNHSENMI
jgi:hypothetical protein